MAEFISLYSGSSGNSSVVRCGAQYLIVDMGKGVRTTSSAQVAGAEPSAIVRAFLSPMSIATM